MRSRVLRRCWFCWWMERWQSRHSEIRIVTYRFCHHVWWMPDYLGKQVANRNFTECYWKRLPFSIKCNARSDSVSRSHEINCRVVWPINKRSSIPLHFLGRQWKLRHIFKEPKVYSPDKAHYHQVPSFPKKISDGTIIIKSIYTTEQIADIFTKTLGENSFCLLRNQLMGWW